MIYKYKKPKGFLWNIIKKLENKFNFKEGTVFLSGNSAEEIIINFPRKLTKEEIKWLNNFMENDPTKPELAGTTFRIVDLWGMQNWFKEKIGKNFIFWFENYEDKLEECYMYLQFPEGLSESEKQLVMKTYRELIEEYRE